MEILFQRNKITMHGQVGKHLWKRKSLDRLYMLNSLQCYMYVTFTDKIIIIHVSTSQLIPHPFALLSMQSFNMI